MKKFGFKHLISIYVLTWIVAFATDTVECCIAGSLLGCTAGPIGILIGAVIGVVMQFIMK